jgi:XapX domain-containing protein
MMESLLALLAGVLVGVLFSLVGLPLPAPPVLPGVMGVVGVYAGGLVAQQLTVWWSSGG